MIWVGTGLLFAISAGVGSGLSSASLGSMLPFASIMAIAALGQTFVIQQRGIDFSVVGIIDLATVVISKYPTLGGGTIWLAFVIVGLVSLCSGTVIGLAVVKVGISPLIASLGVNALLVGAAQAYSGSTPAAVPQSLTGLANRHVAGLPNTVLLAIIVAAMTGLVMQRSIFGRILRLTGSNPDTARAEGLWVNGYIVSAYAIAGLYYAGAAVVFAAYVGTPDVGAGDPYLLGTIAAVVIGGTALSGGRAGFAASAIGALFLTQLTQLALGLGAPESIQLVLESIVIGAAMSLKLLRGRANWRVRKRVSARLVS